MLQFCYIIYWLSSDDNIYLFSITVWITKKHSFSKFSKYICYYSRWQTSDYEFPRLAKWSRSASPVASIGNFNTMDDESHYDTIFFILPFYEHSVVTAWSLFDHFVVRAIPLNWLKLEITSSIRKRIYVLFKSCFVSYMSKQIPVHRSKGPQFVMHRHP